MQERKETANSNGKCRSPAAQGEQNVANSKNMTAHAGNLRKGRVSEPHGLYFVTKCAQAELSDRQRTDIVLALLTLRDDGYFRLHAFVAMPDHWHALLSLGDAKTPGQTVSAIGRRASSRSRRQGAGIRWQKGFYDHKIRPWEKVVDTVRYIEANPLRKGLVNSAEDWPWSSANAQYREQLDRDFLGQERWEQR